MKHLKFNIFVYIMLKIHDLSLGEVAKENRVLNYAVLMYI